MNAITDAATTAGWGMFSRVPQGAAADIRLTDAQVRVLVALCQYVDRYGAAFPAVETLALMSAQARRTVQRALRRLEQLGYVATLRGGVNGKKGTPSRYTVAYPPARRPAGGQRVPRLTHPRGAGDARTIPD